MKVELRHAGGWMGLLLLLFFSAACKSGKRADDKPEDTYVKGVLHISCDESFKPVMDEQVLVYEGLYPEADIIVHYKPEAECLKDFLVDSIRMVIATRGFTGAEEQLIVDSLKLGPKQKVVAHDLIAVIVHPSSPDSMFSMQEIRDLLTGRLKKDLIPVFDGTRATSTVRVMLDSVLRGQPLGGHVVAAESSVAVIDYVSKNQQAVGFVGYGWLGNMDDPAQAAYRSKIKMAWVESTDSAGFYVIPSQYMIYTKSYPMVRDLVCVLKETNVGGLAEGFANFLTTMQGQLVFRRSYIMPVIYPNYVRDAELVDTLK